MKKLRLRTKAKKIGMLAVSAVLVLCMTFAGLISDGLFNRYANASTQYDFSEDAYIVQPVTHNKQTGESYTTENNYGMPTTFDYEFTISHQVKKGDNTYVVTVKDADVNFGAETEIAGSPFTGMSNTAVTTVATLAGTAAAGISAYLGVASNGTSSTGARTTVETKIKIVFDDIFLSRNDRFALGYVPGIYVYTGELVGDKSNVDSGILVVGNNAVGNVNQVYLHNLYLENRGSIYYSATDVHYNSANQSAGVYGSKDPRALETRNGVNIYILGNSSVLCSNEAFLSRRRTTLTSADLTGFASGFTAQAKDAVAGRHHTSITFSSVDNAKIDMYQEWLLAAYGAPVDAPGSLSDGLTYEATKEYTYDIDPTGKSWGGYKTKYNYYKDKTFQEWFDSGDLVNDFVSAVSGSNYIISGKVRATGPAIAHGVNGASLTSAGALVIDTSGEIMSYAEGRGTGTVRIYSNSVSKTIHNTRLYVKNGTIRNNMYDIRGFSVSEYTGGWCVYINEAVQTTSAYAEDLIAGGTFYSTSGIVNGSGSGNAGHLTIGDPTGETEGPTMVNVVTHDNKPIQFINGPYEDGYQTKNSFGITNVGHGTPYTAVMFRFSDTTNNVLYDGDEWQRRTSIVFLNGDFLCERGVFLSTFHQTVPNSFDVHMLGGRVRTGDFPLYMPAVGFIQVGGFQNTAISPVSTGSVLYLRGNEPVNIRKGSYRDEDKATYLADGIDIEVDAASTSTGGLLTFRTPANTFSGDASFPLFKITGGKVVNKTMRDNPSVMIHIREYGYGGTGVAVEEAYGRVGFIEGGTFESARGSFIEMHETTNDVVMTGGSFEHTRTNQEGLPAVYIGYAGAYTTAYANMNYGDANFYANASGGVPVETTQPYNIGCMYFNGGSIKGNLSEQYLGLVYALKFNQSKTAVFGRERPTGTRGSQNDPYDTELNGDRADNVTKLINIGNSPMITIAASNSLSKLYPEAEAGATTRTQHVDWMHQTSNALVIIDRINFEYRLASGGLVDANTASIKAVVTRTSTHPTLKNYGTLRFTGNIDGLNDNGSTGEGRPAGGIRASVNVIELGDEFEVGSSTKFRLAIEYLNHEMGINGYLIRNALQGSKDFSQYFDVYGYDVQVDEAYEFNFNTSSYLQKELLGGNYGNIVQNISYRTYDGSTRDGKLDYASYVHTLAMEKNTEGYLGEKDYSDWMNINEIYVNWYTYKWQNSVGNLHNLDVTANSAEDGLTNTSPANNKSPNHFKSDDGRADKLMYTAKISSTQDYDAMINDWIQTLPAGTTYSGEVFGEDEHSTGLPKLFVKGYEHIGWTYSGYFAPQYRASSSTNTGIVGLTRGVDTNENRGGNYSLNRELLEDAFISAGDGFKSIYTHTLYAVWELAKSNIGDEPDYVEPQVADTFSGYDASETTMEEIGGIIHISREYDANPIELYTEPTHMVDQYDGHNYTIEDFNVLWYYSPTLNGTYTKLENYYTDEVDLEGNALYNIRRPAIVRELIHPADIGRPAVYSFSLTNIVNVRDSGYYKIEVIATDNDGLTSTTETTYCISITEQQIYADYISMPSTTYEVNVERTLLDPKGKHVLTHEPGEADVNGEFRVVDYYGNILYGYDNEGVLHDLYFKKNTDFPMLGSIDDTDGCIFYSVYDPDTVVSAAAAYPYTFYFRYNYGNSILKTFLISYPRTKVYFDDLKPTTYSDSAPEIKETFFDEELEEIVTENGLTLESREGTSNLYYPVETWPSDPIVAGYRFLGWYYQNKLVTQGAGGLAVADNTHTLSAKWELLAPEATTLSAANQDDTWTNNVFSFNFDGEFHGLTASGLVAGAVANLEANSGAVTYEYYWRKSTSQSVYASGATLSLLNVSESGNYTLEVRATDAEGRSSTKTFSFSVSISPYIIDSISIPSVDWDGTVKQPAVVISYENDNGEKVYLQNLRDFSFAKAYVGSAQNAGEYPYKFIFPAGSNYTVAGGTLEDGDTTITVVFEIVMSVRIYLANLNPPLSETGVTDWILPDGTIIHTYTVAQQIADLEEARLAELAQGEEGEEVEPDPVPDYSHLVPRKYIHPSNFGTYPLLPTPKLGDSNPAYSFSGTWTYGNFSVSANGALRATFDHEISAMWNLKTPTVVLGNDRVGDTFTKINDTSYTLNFSYDRMNHSVVASADVAGITDGISLTYIWRRNAPTGQIYGYSSALSFSDISQAGDYYVMVTATDNDYNVSYSSYIKVAVNISAKSITDSDITVTVYDGIYQGDDFFVNASVVVTHKVYTSATEYIEYQLVPGVDYTYNPGGATGAVGKNGVEITVTGKNAYKDFLKRTFVISDVRSAIFQTALGTPPPSMPFEQDGMDNYVYGTLSRPANIPTGYTFMGWSRTTTDGIYREGIEFAVSGGAVLYPSTHVLTAVFKLNQIKLATLTNINEIYNRVNYTRTAIISFEDGAPQNLSTIYTWEKGYYTDDSEEEWLAYEGGDADTWLGANKTFTNFTDSGVWRLTVLAMGLNGLTSTAEEYIKVNIARKEIDEVTINSQNWDSFVKSPVINISADGYALQQGVDFIYTRRMTLTSGDPDTRDTVNDAGVYFYDFTFINNYTGSVSTTFTVVMAIRVKFTNLTPPLSEGSLVIGDVTPTNDGHYPALTPTANNVAGYTFVRWEYNGAEIEAGDALAVKYDHTLSAVWRLVAPSLTVSSAASDFAYDETNEAYPDGVYTLGFTYDLAARLVTVGVTLPTGMKTTGASYTYTWYRYVENKTEGQTDEYIGSTKSQSFINYTQSGKYYVIVTMTDNLVEAVSVTTKYIIVDIKQMDLSHTDSGEFPSSYIRASVLDGIWTGSSITINVTVAHITAANGSYQLISSGESAEFNISPKYATDPGTYTITITATANGNYKGSTTVTFTIINNSSIIFITSIGTAPANGVLVSGKYNDLPVLSMSGYEFMGWSKTNFSGIYVEGETLIQNGETAESFGTHMLSAVWRMNNVTVNANQMENDDIKPGSTANVVLHDYDGTTVTATATPTFVKNTQNTTDEYLATSAIPVGAVIRYTWTKGTVESTSINWTAAAIADIRSGSTQTFTSVSDSGLWKLEIAVTGALGMTESYVQYVRVTVNPRNMTTYITSTTYPNFDNGELDLGSASWDDTIKVPLLTLTYKNSADTIFTLRAGEDYTIALSTLDGESYSGEVKSVGEYVYTITFIGNYSGTVAAVFVIEMNIKVYLGDIATTLSNAHYDSSGTVQPLKESGENGRYYVLPSMIGKYPALPAPISEGYTFKGWVFSDTNIPLTGGTLDLIIKGNHTITPVWEINTPTLGLSGTGLTSTGANSFRLEFVYDRAGHAVTAVGSVGATADGTFTYSYKWTKGGTVLTGATQYFTNVSEAGTYTITVTAMDNVLAAKTSTVTYTIVVDIAAKNIAHKSDTHPLSYLTASANNVTWTGNPLTQATLPAVTLIHFVDGVSYAVSGFTVALDGAFADTAFIGTYTLILTPTDGNYTGTREITFSVTSDLYVNFYSSFGGAPAQTALVNGKYPSLPNPTIIPAGYTFVGWSYSNTTGVYDDETVLVTTGGTPVIDPLSTHTLSAVWTMNTASVSAKNSGGTSNISHNFDGTAQTLSAELAFAGSAPASYNAEYTWTKVGSSSRTGAVQSFTNVSESGTWTITAVITGQLGIKQTVITTVVVSIAARDMETYIADNYTDGEISIQSASWDGSIKSPVIVITYNNGVTEFTLVAGQDYTVTAPAGEVRNAAPYTYTINFINNYDGTVSATFDIEMDVRVYLADINPQLATAAFSTTPAFDSDEGKYYIIPNNNGTYPAMPVLTASGYTFKGWTFGGVAIGTNLSVKGNHTLTAGWELSKPTASITGADYTAATKTFAFTHDRAMHSITASGLLGGQNVGSFTYVWRKGSAGGTIVSSGAALSLTNVSDSGDYYLVVTVSDGVLTPAASDAIKVTVAIAAKTIATTQADNANSYFIVVPTDVVWTGYNLTDPAAISVTVTHKTTGLSDYVLVRDTDFEVTFTTDGDRKDTGAYSLTITARSGNYAGTTTTTFYIYNTVKVQFFTSLGKAPAAVDLENGYYPATLPTPTQAPDGYTFVGWSITNTSGVYVSDAELIVAGAEASTKATHTLSAVWRLNAVSVTANDIEKTFDGKAAASTANIVFASSTPASYSVTYIWTKGTGTDENSWVETTGANSDERSGKIVSFTNHSDSGLWRLVVTVSGQLGMTTTREIYVKVSIAKLDMAEYIRDNNANYDNGTGKLSLSSATWNGDIKSPNINFSYNNGSTTINLRAGEDYTITAPAEEVRNAKDYEYIITFIGNYKGTVDAVFTVSMGIRISFTNLKPAYSAASATKAAVEPTENGEYQNLGAPDTTNVTGYTFSHWVFMGETITNGKPLEVVGDHSLSAVWTLNTPDVTVEGSGTEVVYSEQENQYTLSFVYDRTAHSIAALAGIDGITNGISYSYTWYKGEVGSGTVFAYGFAQSFTNVSQNGNYYVIVTASDNVVPASQSEAIKVFVDIKAKNLAAADITVDIPERVWTGLALAPNITITHNGEVLRSNEFTYSSSIEGESFIAPKTYYITISSATGNYTGTRLEEYNIVDGRKISFFTDIGTPITSYVTTADGKYPALPEPVAYGGFEFLHWTYNDKVIVQGMQLEYEDSHTLRAVWKLNDITITNESGLVINKTYSMSEYSLTAVIGFAGGDAPQTVSYSYLWEKVEWDGSEWVLVDGVDARENRTESFINVSDSGTWRLTIIARSHGYESTDTAFAVVTIEEKSFVENDTDGAGKVTLVIPAAQYNALVSYTLDVLKTMLTARYAGRELEEGRDFVLSSTETIFAAVNDYTITVTAVAGSNFSGSRDIVFSITNDSVVTFVTLVGTAPASITPAGEHYYNDTTTNLPVLTATGYTFVGWEYNGQLVERDADSGYINIATSGSHVLAAKWTLDVPDVTVASSASKKFDWNALNIEANAAIDGREDFIFEYVWTKGSTTVRGKILSLTNVSDSGEWTLVVYAKDTAYAIESQSAPRTVTINITPVSFATTDVEFYVAQMLYNGNALNPIYRVTYLGWLLVEDRDYILTHPDRADGYVNTGVYELVFTGEGNFIGNNSEDFVIFNPSTIYYNPTLSGVSLGGLVIENVNDKPATGDRYPALPEKLDLENLSGAEGYTFLGWYNGADNLPAISGAPITTGGTSVSLYAKWELKSFTVALSSGGIQLEESGGSFVFTANYEADAASIITATPTHLATNNITYSFTWRKGGLFVASTETLSLTNVSSGGTYTLEVVANGKAALSSTVTVTLVVTVTAKTTDLSATISEAYWDGSGKTPVVTITDGGYTLLQNTDYTLYWVEGESGSETLTLISANSQKKNAGTYPVRIVYKNNYGGEDNLEFVIHGWTITLVGWTELEDGNPVNTTYGTVTQSANGKYPALPSAETMNLWLIDKGTTGYLFDGWVFNKVVPIVEGIDLKQTGNHAISASWKLRPTLIDEINEEESDEFRIITDPETNKQYFEVRKDFVPGEEIVINATPNAEDSQHSDADVSYTYSWSYREFDAIAGRGMILMTSSTLFADSELEENGTFKPTVSGIYKVRITATDKNGITTVTEYEFYVYIKPFEVTQSNIDMRNVFFNNSIQTPVYTVTFGATNIPYTISKIEYAYETDQRFLYAGVYKLTLKFDGIRYRGENNTNLLVVEYYINNINIRFDNLKGEAEPMLEDENTGDSVYYQSSFSGYYPKLPTLGEIEDDDYYYIDGYRFVGWTYNGTSIVAKDQFMPMNTGGEVTLRAVWALVAPDLDSDNQEIEETYTINDTEALVVEAEHFLSGNDIEYGYSWKWTKDNGTTYTSLSEISNTLTVQHAVANTGTYIVTVTARDRDGLTATAEYIFALAITPKEDVAPQLVTYPYTASPYPAANIEIVIMDGDYKLERNKDYQNVRHGENNSNAYEEVGNYYITVDLIGNYTGTTTVTVKVSPIVITLQSSKGTLPSTTATANNDLYANLPTLENITGYDFIGWEYNGEIVENGESLRAMRSHRLDAVWQLAAPDVSYARMDTAAEYTDISVGVVRIEYEYSFVQGLTLKPLPTHDIASASFDYKWYTKNENGVYYNIGFTEQSYTAIKNVAQSGWYKVEVYAKGDGETSNPTTLEFYVIITAKNFADLEITITPATYNGAEQRPEIVVKDIIGGSTYTLNESVSDFTINHGTNQYVEVKEGGYQILLNFKGNYFGENVSVTYMINKLAISLWEVELFDNGREVLVDTVYSADGLYPALPTLADVPGYKFAGWSFQGDTVLSGDSLALMYNHRLVALWKLADIAVGYENGINGRIITVYNHQKTITLSPTAEHYLDGTSGLTYSFEWFYRESEGSIYASTGVYNQSFGGINSVSQSGWYMLKVTASLNGRTSSVAEIVYHVTVTPKPMTADSIFVEAVYYTGKEIKPQIIITDIEDGVNQVLIETRDYHKELSSPINAGDHKIYITFIDNYSGTRVEITFKILPYEISFENLKGQSISDTYYSTSTGNYPELPILNNLTGYTFMGWAYASGTSSVEVTSGIALKNLSNHALAAVWVLDAPTVAVNGISAVYSGEAMHTTASASHSVSGIIYDYVWMRGNVVISTSNRLEVKNVSDSGEYTLTVTAIDANNLRSSVSIPITIAITPKIMDNSSIEIGSIVYDGEGHAPEVQIKDGDYLLEYGKDYIIVGGKDEQYYDSGNHSIEIQFIGNYAGAGGQVIEQRFVIKPSRTIFPWWVLLIIGAAALLLIAGLIWLFLFLRRRRLNRYGMKRYVKTFLDRFDET